MQKKKDVLTTGQVAQICNVAPRTVTKWFDSGQLKGYRIPGSKDRRIPTSELIRFMKSHDMPTDGLEFGSTRVLVIDSHSEQAQILADGLCTKKDYDIETATNSFDAGIVAQKLLPHIIIINLMASGIDADQVCQYVRSNQDLSSTKVIALAPGLADKEVNALLNKGYDAAVTDIKDHTHIATTIEHLTAILF